MLIGNSIKVPVNLMPRSQSIEWSRLTPAKIAERRLRRAVAPGLYAGDGHGPPMSQAIPAQLIAAQLIVSQSVAVYLPSVSLTRTYLTALSSTFANWHPRRLMTSRLFSPYLADSLSMARMMAPDSLAAYQAASGLMAQRLTSRH